MDQHTEPMTSGEVAAIFGVTMTTVKRWAESGRLAHFKTVGGHYRFRAEDVAALKASTEVGVA
jgi:excisionase family DNA binding protein